MTIRPVVALCTLGLAFIPSSSLKSSAAADRHRQRLHSFDRAPKNPPSLAELTTAARGADRTASVPQALCLCGAQLSLDGDISEFVRNGDDSQAYFVVDSFDPRFGLLQSGVTICAPVVWSVDSAPSPGHQGQAGPTGFADSPARNGTSRAPTGFNIGWILAAYSPDQDPDGDPTNGTGVYMIAIDVSAPAELDFTWGTQPVAFDVDGDGSRVRQTEIAPNGIGEVPLDGGDVYAVEIDTDNSGRAEVTVKIAEMIDRFPPDAVFIDPDNHPQNIDGFQLHRLIRFIDWTRTLPGTPQDQSVQFLDAYCDGHIDWRDFGIDADIELAVTNVTALPRNTNPSQVTIRVWADAVEDIFWSAGLDTVTLRAGFSTTEPSGPCNPVPVRGP